MLNLNCPVTHSKLRKNVIHRSIFNFSSQKHTLFKSSDFPKSDDFFRSLKKTKSKIRIMQIYHPLDSKSKKPWVTVGPRVTRTWCLDPLGGMSGVPNGFRMGSNHVISKEFASYRSSNRFTSRDFALLDNIRPQKAPKN